MFSTHREISAYQIILSGWKSAWRLAVNRLDLRAEWLGAGVAWIAGLAWNHGPEIHAGELEEELGWPGAGSWNHAGWAWITG